jgi:hypothetical protein
MRNISKNKNADKGGQYKMQAAATRICCLQLSKKFPGLWGLPACRDSESVHLRFWRMCWWKVDFCHRVLPATDDHERGTDGLNRMVLRITPGRWWGTEDGGEVNAQRRGRTSEGYRWRSDFHADLLQGLAFVGCCGWGRWRRRMRI